MTKKPNYNDVKDQQFGSTLPQVYKAQEAIYDEESVNMKDFVIGAFVGGIIGAAAGLLLAPKSGSELRDDVAIQAVNLKDKSLELSSTAKNKTAELSQQLQEQTSQLVDKVKTLKDEKLPSDDGTASIEGEESLADEAPKQS